MLANVIASQGYAVHREFYYNDAGVQIGNLAISTQARARGLKPGDAGWPEAAYNGEYIADIARDFLNGETVAASDGEPVKARATSRISTRSASSRSRTCVASRTWICRHSA